MPQRSALPLVLLLLLGADLRRAPRAQAEEPTGLAPKADDTPVSGTVRLLRGAYAIPDAKGDGALRITEDGTTLDLRGAALIGSDDDTPADRYAGVGIRIEGAKNVRIRGGVIRGYKIAIQAINAPGLVIEAVDASENFRQRLGSTPQREDPSDWLWPHTNDGGEWERRYGAGFSLTRCDGAQVSRCRVRDGQNGLLLTRCKRARIYDNDFSFNSGWGIGLYRSSHAVIASNHCDFCVRGFSYGTYRRGQDSAGILLFEQSSHNLIVGNSATHSGDGLFLYAGHETTQRTGTGGCDGNVVHGNDFSYAVANGIEATFSVDNVFVRNRCDHCDHGIWAGYSARSFFGGNLITRSTTAGISIEHGQANRIVHNTITGGGIGIHLWWDHDKAFVDGVFGAKRDTSSSKNVILGNDITSTQTALKLVRDTETTIRWNQLHAYQTLFELGAGTRLGAVEQNLFRGMRSTARPAPVLARGAGVADWALPPKNQRRGQLTAPSGWDLASVEEAMALVRPPPRLPESPKVPGSGPRSRPPEQPRGKHQIRVGTWGPLDPSLPGIHPRVLRVSGAKVSAELLGQGPYRVVSVDGDVDVGNAVGNLPARLTVAAKQRPSGTAGSDLRPFVIVIDMAGRRETIRGHLLAAVWNVAWFGWTEDPRTAAEAWQRQVDATLTAMREDGKRSVVSAIDFPWGAGGPQGVAPDRFGTVATTTLRLPAGRYRFRTLSDDGIRLFVGSKRVLERWTHHATTEDVVELDLPAGSHALRIEHFEIDGAARLGFTLERVR